MQEILEDAEWLLGEPVWCEHWPVDSRLPVHVSALARSRLGGDPLSRSETGADDLDCRRAEQRRREEIGERIWEVIVHQREAEARHVQLRILFASMAKHIIWCLYLSSDSRQPLTVEEMYKTVVDAFDSEAAGWLCDILWILHERDILGIRATGEFPISHFCQINEDCGLQLFRSQWLLEALWSSKTETQWSRKVVPQLDHVFKTLKIRE